MDSLNNLRDSLDSSSRQAGSSKRDEADLSADFKAAALHLTALYRTSLKTSTRAYSRGYVAALADLLDIISLRAHGSGGQAEAMMEDQGSSTGDDLAWLERYLRGRMDAMRGEAEEEDAAADDVEAHSHQQQRDSNTSLRSTQQRTTRSSTVAQQQQPSSSSTARRSPPALATGRSTVTQPSFNSSGPAARTRAASARGISLVDSTASSGSAATTAVESSHPSSPIASPAPTPVSPLPTLSTPNAFSPTRPTSTIDGTSSPFAFGARSGQHTPTFGALSSSSAAAAAAAQREGEAQRSAAAALKRRLGATSAPRTCSLFGTSSFSVNGGASALNLSTPSTPAGRAARKAAAAAARSSGVGAGAGGASNNVHIATPPAPAPGASTRSSAATMGCGAFEMHTLSPVGEETSQPSSGGGATHHSSSAAGGFTTTTSMASLGTASAAEVRLRSMRAGLVVEPKEEEREERANGRRGPTALEGGRGKRRRHTHHASGAEP